MNGYYGVWAVRGGRSIFGAAEAWCQDLDGEPILLDTQEEALQLAAKYNSSTRSANVRYRSKEMEQELAAAIILRR